MQQRRIRDKLDITSDFFSPDLLNALRQHAIYRDVGKDEILFRYGSASDGLFCVEAGKFVLCAFGPGGREAVMSVLEPGHWFGEMSLFTDTPRIYEARALVASRVMSIPAAAFHEIVDVRPEFLLEFLGLISTRYRWALEWIDESILVPFPVRLARRVLAAQYTHRLPKSNESVATIRISQEDLGHMLGVSRQTVQRQLKEWEALGLLTLEYGRITVLGRAALQRLAGQPSESDQKCHGH